MIVSMLQWVIKASPHFCHMNFLVMKYVQHVLMDHVPVPMSYVK